jgi:hypothetical protein
MVVILVLFSRKGALVALPSARLSWRTSPPRLPRGLPFS